MELVGYFLQTPLIDMFDEDNGLWEQRTNTDLFTDDDIRNQRLLCDDGDGCGETGAFWIFATQDKSPWAPWTGEFGINPLEFIKEEFNPFNCDCNDEPDCEEVTITDNTYLYNPYMCEVYEVEMPPSIFCGLQQLDNPRQVGNDLLVVFTFGYDGSFGSPLNINWNLTLPPGFDNPIICYGCDEQGVSEVVFTIKDVSPEMNTEEIKVSATANFLECGEINKEMTFTPQINSAQGNDDLVINGDRNICDNQAKTYFLSGEVYLPPPFNCYNWTSSPSIDIVSTSATGVIEIRPNTSTADEYWIQAIESPGCRDYDICTPPRVVRLDLDVADFCSAGCVSNSEEYINITEDEVWDERTSVAGDVIVWPGAELTIKSTVYFTKGHGLDIERGAKVHIDGGTLTKCSAAESWRGVRVRGNPNLFHPDPFSMPSGNQCGVFLSQNGTVEWARYGVYAGYNHSNLYPPNHSGGLVYCENTTFSNNTTAVLFPAYNIIGFENQSRFRGCHFEGGDNGVIIQRSDGIQFAECAFNGQSVHGIRTYDSGCLITGGCRFSNCRKGIRVFSTSPSASGEAVVISSLGGTENRFERNSQHIYCGSDGLFSNVVINDNYFGDCTEGIVLHGPVSAEVSDNTFEGDISEAILLFNLGDNATNIYCNDFDMPGNGSTGIWAEGNNIGTEFTTNIFNTHNWDFSLTSRDGVKGEIMPLQGNPMEGPANNCFSTQHKNHLVTHEDTSDPDNILTEGFSYYLPENPDDECSLMPSDEGVGTHNYGLPLTDNISGEDCIPGIEGFLLPPCDDYISIKNEYDDLVATYGSNAGTAEGLAELIRVGRIKEAAISECLRAAILSGETDFIKEIVDQEGTVDALYKYYGVNLRIKDLEKAEDILNQIPINGDEEQDFVDVQAINLRKYKYEQENADFQLTNSEYSLLDEIAHSNSRSKGYAMGLLSLLEGIEIDIEKSPIEEGYTPENTGGGNTNAGGGPTTSITVSPNPASDGVKVELPNFIEGKVFFSLYGIGSEPEKTFMFEGGKTFELKFDGVADGLYALQIATEAEVLDVINIVVAH